MNRDIVEKEMRIPSEHPCYSDHFPGSPIVPGAVLISWLFEMIDTDYTDVVVGQIKSIKFISAVLPGDLCTVKLYRDDEKKKIKIQVNRSEDLILKGDVSFG